MPDLTTIVVYQPAETTIKTNTKNGPQGPTGSTGPTGPTGPAGGVNTVNGASGTVTVSQIGTAAATASTIPIRDGSGRMKAAAPSASDDVANKTYTDSLRITGMSPITSGYSSTWTPNAALSNIHRMTLTGNVTINGPSNPTDGQQIILELTQDATGGRAIILSVGTGHFAFGSDISAITPSSAPGKMDRLVAMYRSASFRWEILSILRGF